MQEARPRTHLAIVRVNLDDDLDLADKHFAAAEKLDAGYTNLRQFRVALANAHARQQDWGGAADYLERYMDFTESLAESQPGNRSVVAAHEAVEKRLATLRRFAEMKGNPSPAFNTQHWVQGKAVKLNELRAKWWYWTSARCGPRRAGRGWRGSRSCTLSTPTKVWR